MHKLKVTIISNNYPVSVIEKGISMATSIPQEILRGEKSTATQSKDIPSISIFDKSDVFPKIKDIYKVAQPDKSLKPIFRDVNIINCRRQRKNLKQMMTNASFKETKENYRVTKALALDVNYVILLLKRNIFSSNNNCFMLMQI